MPGTYQTSDGSHISFFGCASNGGVLSYVDGSQVTMSVVNNYLQPTQVLDRNGNFVTLSYQSSANGYNPLSMNSITDTLGRVIQFNYTAPLPGQTYPTLTSISEPAMGSGSQAVLNFYYTSPALSYNFSGLFPAIGFTSGYVLHAITNPNTNSGSVYTYGDYGMIYKVSARTQMAEPAGDGVEQASATFNYPTSGSTQLTDAPAFTQRTESPGGTYSYSASTNPGAQTATFTITRPTGSTMALTRSTDAASVANGLLTQTEVDATSGGAMLRKAVFSYANDPGGSPQVVTTTTYDDTN
ncbi:MAG TPA: hypothetical protein VJX67_01380, partial [Blastocatellia bacterium]|nr:hypothetical protein [Blastocatellia bacterium]